MSRRAPELHISLSSNGRVTKIDENTWHLEIPAHTSRRYHLAQLDDHATLARSEFQWKPPISISLQAQVSAQELPGTWGFGFWNYPFSFRIGHSWKESRLPTLPHAAWFFHASPQNYLSIRDDIPANGFLAATFWSRRVPLALMALASPALLLTLIPGASRLVRRAARSVIRQDAWRVQTDVTTWHSYRVDWEPELVRFHLDGAEVHRTNITPRGPASLVLWVDNQYASMPPAGGIKYGVLPNPEPVWMEIRELWVEQ